MDLNSYIQKVISLTQNQTSLSKIFQDEETQKKISELIVKKFICDQADTILEQFLPKLV